MKRNKNIRVCIRALTGVIIVGCSGPQTGDEAIKRKKKGENVTVEEGATTSIAISSGNLNGTVVDVPPGSLPVGATLNARESSQPASFKSAEGVSSASPALAISAETEDGNEVVSLEKPMTLQLPMSSTSLALAIERTDDNLCAFLETRLGDKYVWRRTALSVKDGKVVFESKKLGIFQVVYCGQQSLSGFTEATETGVAGSASESFVELTVPTSLLLPFGKTHYCAGVISGVDDDSKEGEEKNEVLWGFTRVEANHSAAQVIEIKRSPGKNLADLADETKNFVFVFAQNASDNCNFENKEIDRPGGQLLAWRFLGSAFKNGTVAGVIGEDSLPLATLNLSIMTGANIATPTDKKICIESDADGVGVSEIMTSISADGLINGEEEFEVYYVPGSKSVMNIYIGSENCNDDSQDRTPVTTDPSKQVMTARFNNFSGKSALQLAPTKVNIAGISLPSIPGVSLPFPLACVAVFDPNDAITTADNSSHREKAVLSMVVAAGASATYESYIPVLNQNTAGIPVYDVIYKGIESNGTCSSSGKNTTKTPNKTLTNPLDIAPPPISP